MKWIFYLIGALLVAWAVWSWITERKKINESAARARQAKADKKLFSTLNLNGDESIRQSSEKIDP